MKNIFGKGINSRLFKTFWVMLLIFALIIPYMNGIRIQVHAADTATVFYIYADVSGEYPTGEELVAAGSDAPESKDRIGLFITDGNYTLTSGDSNKFILANNASVTVGNNSISEFKLSGNSNLIYTGHTISSTEGRFPAYQQPEGGITIESVMALYNDGDSNTPYYTNPDEGIWSDPYDLTVTGNMTIAGNPGVDNEGHPIIEPYWIGYNDIQVASTGRISIEEGGHLLVQGSLTVNTGGRITGSGDDHFIRICQDATVSGLSLFASPDGYNVSTNFESSSPGEFEFRYDSSSTKWFYSVDFSCPVFFFNIGGIDLANETIEVQYKYPDSGYTYASPGVVNSDEGGASFGIALKNKPENVNSVTLKITFIPAANSTKTMLCWWDSPDPVGSSTDGISGNVFEHSFNIEGAFLDVSLGYINSGNPEIVDTANNYLYAYSGDDDTIKTYLATELYNRFIRVPMFEDFGIGNAGDLVSRITKTGSLNSISATPISGSDVSISVNNYKVEWGYNSANGDPVVSNIPVYTLTDRNDFLICTDFNKNTGTGTTFYIRKALTDEIHFDGVAQDAIPVVVPSINPDRIVVGGMGADTSVLNKDNVYAFTLSSRWLNAQDGPSQDSDPANYGTIVRIMISSQTYVMLTGTGENNRFGGIGNNGFGTDTIWNTRSDGKAEAVVYIGHNMVHLKSLAEGTGLTTRVITAVEVSDATIAAGVHIDDSDMSDIRITFDSNFYASIPLNITYSGGGTKKLTINRVGLVIQYSYLGGNPNMDIDQPDSIQMGSDNTSATTTLQYDYFAGEQIVVYGIYYTPSNDPTGGSSNLNLYLTFNNGTHRVIIADNDDTLTMSNGNTVSRGFNGRLGATNGSVATTIFLIGFAQAKTFDGNLWVGNITDTYYKDEGRTGFYASVLNAGWDSDDNFGGTQIGSGKGIYWDGHITWY